jgi:hypothetical protein
MAEDYGDWGDWILCFAILVLLEARLPSMSPKNPEGHSPQYWKKHPEALARRAPASDSSTSPKQKSISSLLWSWHVIGIVVGLVLGGGINMSLGHPLIADAFYLVGFALLVLRLLTWDEFKLHRKKWGFLPLPICFLVIVGNHALNEVWPFALRSQLEFSCHMNGVYRSGGRDTEGEPLLFKGQDFSRTDVKSARAL